MANNMLFGLTIGFNRFLYIFLFVIFMIVIIINVSSSSFDMLIYIFRTAGNLPKNFTEKSAYRFSYYYAYIPIYSSYYVYCMSLCRRLKFIKTSSENI